MKQKEQKMLGEILLLGYFPLVIFRKIKFLIKNQILNLNEDINKRQFIALSDNQVISYLNSSPDVNEQGLIAYYNFNVSSGSTLIDISGNGNNGNDILTVGEAYTTNDEFISNFSGGNIN